MLSSTNLLFAVHKMWISKRATKTLSKTKEIMLVFNEVIALVKRFFMKYPIAFGRYEWNDKRARPRCGWNWLNFKEIAENFHCHQQHINFDSIIVNSLLAIFSLSFHHFNNGGSSSFHRIKLNLFTHAFRPIKLNSQQFASITENVFID